MLRHKLIATLLLVLCGLALVAIPAQARFLQTDPVGYKDDVNWYAYVQNDPTNRTDPTGQFYESTDPNRDFTSTLGKAQMQAAQEHPVLMGTIAVAVGGIAIGAEVVAGGGLGAAAGETVVLRGAALEARAAEVHGVLDPIAQGQRTTAVLETSGGRVVASGGRDLTPAQRAALQPGEVAAKQSGAHAEATALDHAAATGAKPQALGTTRTICPECQAKIEQSGGTVTSKTTAEWPKKP